MQAGLCRRPWAMAWSPFQRTASRDDLDFSRREIRRVRDSWVRRVRRMAVSCRRRTDFVTGVYYCTSTARRCRLLQQWKLEVEETAVHHPRRGLSACLSERHGSRELQAHGLGRASMPAPAAHIPSLLFEREWLAGWLMLRLSRASSSFLFVAGEAVLLPRLLLTD